MRKTLNLTAAALGGMISLSACTTTSTGSNSATIADLQMRLSAVEGEAQRSADIIAIWRLQSLYQHYMSTGQRREITKLFADRDDVEIELSNKGIMTGPNTPERYFMRTGPDGEWEGPWGDDNPMPAPGLLIFHTSVNPAIQVNSDGTKATAVWLSPGLTTVPRGNAPQPNWNYGKYNIDYVKEDGEWKILHFRWHQIFYVNYHEDWVTGNKDPGAANPNPDVPSAPDFYSPYNPDKSNVFAPPPPPPYED